jgi:hypothetical protein
MSATRDYYRKQAEQAEHDAAEARLDNVRDRALRSARAWRSMAERLERAESMRLAREAEKAAASS